MSDGSQWMQAIPGGYVIVGGSIFSATVSTAAIIEALMREKSPLANWVKKGGEIGTDVVVPRSMLSEFQTKAQDAGIEYEVFDRDRQSEFVTIAYKDAMGHEFNGSGEYQFENGTRVPIRGSREAIKAIETDINNEYIKRCQKNYDLDLTNPAVREDINLVDKVLIPNLTEREATILREQMSRHWVENSMLKNADGTFNLLVDRSGLKLGRYEKFTPVEKAMREMLYISNDDRVNEFLDKTDANIKHAEELIMDEENYTKGTSVVIYEPENNDAAETARDHSRNFYIDIQGTRANVVLEDTFGYNPTTDIEGKGPLRITKMFDISTEAGRNAVMKTIASMHGVEIIEPTDELQIDRYHKKDIPPGATEVEARAIQWENATRRNEVLDEKVKIVPWGDSHSKGEQTPGEYFKHNVLEVRAARQDYLDLVRHKKDERKEEKKNKDPKFYPKYSKYVLDKKERDRLYDRNDKFAETVFKDIEKKIPKIAEEFHLSEGYEKSLTELFSKDDITGAQKEATIIKLVEHLNDGELPKEIYGSNSDLEKKLDKIGFREAATIDQIRMNAEVRKGIQRELDYSCVRRDMDYTKYVQARGVDEKIPGAMEIKQEKLIRPEHDAKPSEKELEGDSLAKYKVPLYTQARIRNSNEILNAVVTITDGTDVGDIAKADQEKIREMQKAIHEREGELKALATSDFVMDPAGTLVAPGGKDALIDDRAFGVGIVPTSATAIELREYCEAVGNENHTEWYDLDDIEAERIESKKIPGEFVPVPEYDPELDLDGHVVLSNDTLNSFLDREIAEAHNTTVAAERIRENEEAAARGESFHKDFDEDYDGEDDRYERDDRNDGRDKRSNRSDGRNDGPDFDDRPELFGDEEDEEFNHG